MSIVFDILQWGLHTVRPETVYVFFLSSSR